ncbi:MAG: nucleotidyltransferase domain-containing protein [Rhodothermales bacterium]
MNAPAMTVVSPSIQTLLSELKARLGELYGERLEDLLLFGSHARGDAGANSDVDVMVVLRGPVDAHEEIHRMVSIVVELELAWGMILSVLPVAEVDYHRASKSVIVEARRDGTIV